jgi:hypothetical protein
MLGLLAAPAIIRTPGLLMPVRPMPGRRLLWPVKELTLRELHAKYPTREEMLVGNEQALFIEAIDPVTFIWTAEEIARMRAISPRRRPFAINRL